MAEGTGRLAAALSGSALPGALTGRPLLEVSGLSKAFGGLRAVRDLSFTIAEGEILGVVGPNGSGKTTVFNLIAGALRPDAGEVHLSGRRITTAPPSRRSALGIARTFQLVRALTGLTVLENVLVAAMYGRAPPSRPGAEAETAGGRPGSGPRSLADPRSEALRLLELVGLASWAEVFARYLTLAQRKQVEIARALATRPLLLLLDEPLAGLNPTEVAAMLALFRKIHAEGVTLALVEHNVVAVRALCGRLLVLNSGRLIAEGRPDEALAQPEVIEVYLGAHAAH
ncbi:MAG TPA: ABC transporter ATP-binding protein [bacterium]|nr:ABC transporter ATP-binding protein [bacterium]